ncbi:hypothetical protein ACP70R_041049 [Stipagrostis hirtigluma subsp. patula]
MTAFPRWEDLQPELLGRIGDRLDLKCYASARGACTAWRGALAPPTPALLTAASGSGRFLLSAASLPTRRSFEVAAITPDRRCVGSSSGWLALRLLHAFLDGHGTALLLLFNPVTGAEIALPPLIHETRWVLKVVFAPSPAEDDFAAAAICGFDRVAYVTAGARRWAVLDPVRLAAGDQLADIVYHDDGKVYCLTRGGDVHVLRLPERRRRRPAPATVEDPYIPEPSVPRPHDRLQLWPSTAQDQEDSTVPVKITRRRRRTDHWVLVPHDSDKGPDLNPPATMEPLFSGGNLPSNPATIFGPPYDTVSVITSAKHLVLCEGDLYQVWRNTSCAVTLQLPGGGQRRVSENEVFVLRYYPQRQPCWDVVKDLGGYSFFVGRNNSVAMYAEGAPGLRGNCVYWIGGRAKDQGMVFDMETGRSTPCSPPPPVMDVPGYLHSTICWYFLSDLQISNSNKAGRRTNSLSISQ